jgi:hypothetical protein
VPLLLQLSTVLLLLLILISADLLWGSICLQASLAVALAAALAMNAICAGFFATACIVLS